MSARDKSYRVEKNKLLATLRENRAKHAAAFKETWAGYERIMLDEMKRQLAAHAEGKPNAVDDRRFLAITRPRSHERDYDSEIGLLEYCIDAHVDLDREDYERFVLDVWNWTASFRTTWQAYNSSNSLDEVRRSSRPIGLGLELDPDED